MNDAFESMVGVPIKGKRGGRMHARARPAPIASENIPQMVHPARGGEEIGAPSRDVHVHTRACACLCIIRTEVSRIKHVLRYLDSAEVY